MKKGPFKVLSTRKVYKNPWITVREDTVMRPGGGQGLYGVVDYGKGVSIVALSDTMEVFLVKEYYYAIEEYGIQLPSGGIEEKEMPIDAAKRELVEETGGVGKTWYELGFVHPLTMALRSPAYLYLALDVKQKGKGEEHIDVIKVPFAKAYHMVLENKIVHAPSCVAILKAKIFLETLKK